MCPNRCKPSPKITMEPIYGLFSFLVAAFFLWICREALSTLGAVCVNPTVNQKWVDSIKRPNDLCANNQHSAVYSETEHRWSSEVHDSRYTYYITSREVWLGLPTFYFIIICLYVFIFLSAYCINAWKSEIPLMTCASHAHAGPGCCVSVEWLPECTRIIFSVNSVHCDKWQVSEIMGPFVRCAFNEYAPN